MRSGRIFIVTYVTDIGTFGIYDLVRSVVRVDGATIASWRCKRNACSWQAIRSGLCWIC